MFTGSVGSCAVVPYLVNWFIFNGFYFGVILYIIMLFFWGSVPVGYLGIRSSRSWSFPSGQHVLKNKI